MISVIIPVYNHAKELKKCFESILRQSFRNFEIIVVNDGSTDNLNQTINEFEPIFKEESIEFKVISQENRGASVARNRGFLDSKGEYLLFLDADIRLRSNMFYKMKSVLDNKEDCSYVYSSFKFGFKRFKLYPFSARRLRKMPYIHTSSLIRREHFPGFNETLAKFQDWDLWLQMLEKGYKGVWIPKVLFKVKTGGTMSSWIPSIFYKVPWNRVGIKLKEVDSYNDSMAKIKEKYAIKG
jgi:glycosyltransferase involved in cell wall biosynthesis